MKILVFSDVHDLSGYSAAYKMIDVEKPDVALCAGDWGSNVPTQKLHVLAKYSPEFLKLSPLQYEDLFKPILEKTHFHTIMGNHDVPDVLEHLRNRDGSRCLLKNFQSITLNGVILIGISGNIGKTLNKEEPWRTTEQCLWDEYHKAVKRGIMQPYIVLSHEAVLGYANGTDSETGKGSKGQQIMRELLDVLRPRWWFCGHIHPRNKRGEPETQIAQCGNTTIVTLASTIKGHYATLDTESGKLETNKEA